MEGVHVERNGRNSLSKRLRTLRTIHIPAIDGIKGKYL